MATYRLNNGFHFEDGNLFCEDIKVSSESIFIDLHVKSPFFVFSEAQILHNVKQYKDVLDQLNLKYILNYSMKANANPHIMRIFKESGLSLTLVSGMELRFALECGFNPKTLVFNGNGKLDEEIALALKHDVLLNIDSLFNMKQTLRICRKTGHKARLLLRINPGINPDVHRYVSTGQEGSKFGLFSEELQEVIEAASDSKEVEVVGLHCHLGSTIKKTEIIRNSVRVLKHIWKEMKEKGFCSLQYLNIGGGLGIDYHKLVHFECRLQQNQEEELAEIKDGLSHGKVQVPSARDLVESVVDLLEEDMTLVLEPGRSLIA
ncbi:hypothetical protein FSP39_003592 [Pinctada imbricata]|uniref:Orn/DAP/Arg decarboxylase 2 N-terminal domain-containing protein n=1 Tax=Pinctada imbricata TaxID=66713 RepID=A0AA88Y2I1_PINIB|nr:hypothetical protein FSP39_003592 [Pinctada imbricata]